MSKLPLRASAQATYGPLASAATLGSSASPLKSVRLIPDGPARAVQRPAVVTSVGSVAADDVSNRSGAIGVGKAEGAGVVYNAFSDESNTLPEPPPGSTKSVPPSPKI